MCWLVLMFDAACSTIAGAMRVSPRLELVVAVGITFTPESVGRIAKVGALCLTLFRFHLSLTACV